MVLLIILPAAYAGSWSGYVEDGTGTGLSGVNVTAYDASDVYVSSASTDGAGFFNVTGITNSVYLVSSLSGYTTDTTQLLPSAGTNNYVLPFNITLSAANLPGSISGTVDDGTNPIQGATVRALQGTTEIASNTTDASGSYILSDLNDGTYTVEASAANYITQNTDNVLVEPGLNTVVDFTLSSSITSTDADNDTYYAESGCGTLVDFNDNDPNQYPGAPCTRTCYSGSTYDVNGVCTGGSYTCGGGGGGSSSYSGTDYEMDLDPGDIITKELRRRDTVTFDYEGESHTVTVNNVYTSSVSVTVESDPVTEAISLLQTKGFNFDSDLMNDFFITVKSITSGRAEVEFKLKEEAEIIDIPFIPHTPQPDVVDVPQQSGSAVRIMVEDEPVVIEDDEDEESSVFSSIGVFFKNMIDKILYLKYIVAGVALLAVLILIFSVVTRLNTVKKTAKRSRKKEELVQRLKELESQIKELKKAV